MKEFLEALDRAIQRIIDALTEFTRQVFSEFDIRMPTRKDLIEENSENLRNAAMRTQNLSDRFKFQKTRESAASKRREPYTRRRF